MPSLMTRNIVLFFGAGDLDGAPFLVTEVTEISPCVEVLIICRTVLQARITRHNIVQQRNSPTMEKEAWVCT